MPPVTLIAEAGVNHNGDMAIARELISVAADAGADMIKFQTFSASGIVTQNAPKAEYQKAEGDSENQYAMLKRLELSEADHVSLIACCKDYGIDFLSTPFDLESIDLLHRLNLQTIKISSGDITNFPYLDRVARIGAQIILSSGLSSLDEVGAALAVLTNAGTPKSHITVLHCTTEYPAPYIDVNLKAMLTIRNKFGVRVGYSDHTLGIEIPVAAVALGAEVIEKHITLDKSMPGPDHKASMEPDELQAMIKAIRNVEVALGSGIKEIMPGELKNRDVVRKSIVARRAISVGEKFTEDNLAVKRPGTGFSPMLWKELLGKVSDRDYEEDQPIER
jgi:N,N'-diacetyllegionaminate synthase